MNLLENKLQSNIFLKLCRGRNAQLERLIYLYGVPFLYEISGGVQGRSSPHASTEITPWKPRVNVAVELVYSKFRQQLKMITLILQLVARRTFRVPYQYRDRQFWAVLHL